MDAAPFSVHDVNTPRAAVEGTFTLPDGSEVIWGLSRREFGPMSFHGRPDWDVAYNRMQFLKLFGLDIDRVAAPHQEHSADVIRVTRADARKGAREQDSAPGHGDALITSDSGLILMTTHADCLPVWLCAPYHGWTGMAHVGWRGLLAGIVPAMIEAVPGGEREGLTIAIGPGVSSLHYEVSAEVAQKFLNDETLAAIVSRPEGQFALDLAEGIRLQAGNSTSRVVSETWACTFDNSYLSSFRRDGKGFAPMAAFITRTGG